MSAFLGKIHFWLFNKIKNAEDVERKIAQWAEKEKDLNTAEWKAEIQGKYGVPISGEPLENIIDTSNIHGWLQDKITRTETRQAAWITKIIDVSAKYQEQLQNLFSEDGTEKGLSAKNDYEINSPMDVYRVLNDFILEGMPCDAVDKTVENTESIFKWISTECLHKSHWERVSGDVKVFYSLREAWIKSFIKALNDDYSFQVSYEGGRRINTITK